MSSTPPRVLVIDDNLSIHHDFQRILGPRSDDRDLDAEAEALFGGKATSRPPFGQSSVSFQLAFASQGQEGREKVVAARAAAQPFALAFVDMRMPPGWDGLTTIRKIWEIDPELHVVICTAHSDRSWDEIANALTARDRWAILKKPFDKIEVVQLACVMTKKWQLTREQARR